MMSPRIVSLLFAALACSSAMADALYKSVDSAGNVTYSSTPPKGGKVEKLEVAPPPTEAEVQAAEERLKRNAAQANELEAERREKEAAEAEREAEEARLREAQKPAQPVMTDAPGNANQPIDYPSPGAGFPPGMPTGRPIPIRPRPTPLPSSR
jgi:regulator of protease activity HflC (stomatin/prohibitin superfamily)